MKFSMRFLVVYFAFPFFLWSFLGGHKQFFWGIQSDYLMTFLACIACALVLVYGYKGHKLGCEASVLYVVYIVCCIFALFYPKASEDALYILMTYIVYFGISFILSFFFSKHNDIFFKQIELAAVISSVILLLAFIFVGVGSWGRMTIPVYINGGFAYFPEGYTSSSDPNVLAYFLGIGALTLLFKKAESRFFVIKFSCILVALLLTASRSALIAFILAYFTYSVITFNGRVSFKKIIFFFCLFLPALFVSLGYLDNQGLLRIKEITTDSDRMERLSYAIGVIGDISSFLRGNGVGFSRETYDPHNFFIATVMDTGFLSLCVLFGILLFSVYSIWCNHTDKKSRAYAVALLAFFCVIAMFYWQVRTFYFVLLILFVLYGQHKRDVQRYDSMLLN